MTVTRIFDLLDNFDSYPDTNCSFSDKREGSWVNLSPKEYKKQSLFFASGLISFGITKGDKIATVINNCSEWNIIDMGISLVGAVHVPLYPSFSDKEFEYILKHSEAKILIIGEYQLFEPLENIIRNIKQFCDVYSIENINGAENWKIIIDLGKKSEKLHEQTLKQLKLEINADDLATIIYTSGTTGISKGVMLSHNNLISNALAVASRQHLESGSRILSFLPLCHVYERMVNYQYQFLGISIIYGEGMNKIAENLKETRVDGFTAVPRVFEKIYEKILIKGEELHPILRGIFFGALSHAMKFELGNNSVWFKIVQKFYDILVYSKWRKAIGGKIRVAGVGGASCRSDLLRLFWTAKIPVYEGYGLTETSPIITVNYGIPESGNLFKTLKLGSTGKVLNNVEVKLSNEGEILCKGPGVMKGYFKDSIGTDTVFDKEGWFYTGDIGSFDSEGFLSVTGRKKDLFKTSWGKYVAPQHMEDVFRASLFIDQIGRASCRERV